MMNETEPLRRIALFAALTEPTLARLAQQLVLRSYPADEIILHESEPGQAAYFIASGRVQIFRSSLAGREQILANLRPGEAFNVVPLLQPEGSNPASARALSPASLYVLPRQRFLQLVEQSADLGLALLKDFAGKLSHLSGLVEQLSLHSIRGRLAGFLIEQANHGDQAGRWTQDAIAAQIGTVRDVIGRTLRSFEEAGWIKRQHSRIVLLDRQALEKEAEA